MNQWHLCTQLSYVIELVYIEYDLSGHCSQVFVIPAEVWHEPNKWEVILIADIKHALVKYANNQLAKH